MTDSAPQWRATTRRVSPIDTGEYHHPLVAQPSWLRRHRILVIAIAGLMSLAILAGAARAFVFQLYLVPSDSMAPTLEAADRIVVNRLDTSPDRGEIVVHDAPDDSSRFVRRVIAFGGETIAISDGVVTVDGRTLVETYLDPSVVNADFEPFTVPEGQLFLLGDNRLQSYDSRLTGAFDADLVVGTMIWKF